jgi:hypothetical protein
MRFHTKVGSLTLGLAIAAGLAVVGTPAAHAMRFNPQPDPPGRAVAAVADGTTVHRSHSAFQASRAQGMRLDFNPQPDPPGRRASAF